MNTPTSASGRIEAARKALALRGRDSARLAAIETALRALIEPPVTDEGPEEIAERIYKRWIRDDNDRRDEIGVLTEAVHAGIQAAWNTWEPETAPGAPHIDQDWRDDQENVRDADHVNVRFEACDEKGRVVFNSDITLTPVQAVGMFQGIGEAS